MAYLTNVFGDSDGELTAMRRALDAVRLKPDTDVRAFYQAWTTAYNAIRAARTMPLFHDNIELIDHVLERIPEGLRENFTVACAHLDRKTITPEHMWATLQRLTARGYATYARGAVKFAGMEEMNRPREEPERQPAIRARPATPGPEDMPNVVCYKCKKVGHMGRYCPDPEKCAWCTKEGHVARDCPSLAAGYPQVARRTPRDRSRDSYNNRDNASQDRSQDRRNDSRSSGRQRDRDGRESSGYLSDRSQERDRNHDRDSRSHRGGRASQERERRHSRDSQSHRGYRELSERIAADLMALHSNEMHRSPKSPTTSQRTPSTPQRTPTQPEDAAASTVDPAHNVPKGGRAWLPNN
jgi:hypothetical protein